MRNKHSAGSFCWVELITTEAVPAGQFYRQLFDWSEGRFSDLDPSVYKLMQLGQGQAVAGLFSMGESSRAQGIPPHWSNFVAVDDIEKVSLEAVSAGGLVVSPSNRIGDAGSMALLQDPTGALFNLWQADEHAGVGAPRNAPGSTCWQELVTRDAAAAAKFYARLFGWKLALLDEGPMAYGVLTTGGGQEVGGMMQLPPAWKAIPSHWMTYFAVSDCEASIRKCLALGGELMSPASQIEGRDLSAVLRDPQRAVFGIMQKHG